MFHGSLVALVTPMTKAGGVDYEAFASLIEWHIDSGTRGLIVAGTTGEAATLKREEALALMQKAVQIAKERIPVIAGTACQGTAETLIFTKAAKDLGVDACLIMTPAYIKPTQEGLFLHYRSIAEGVSLPIILYNVPGRTMCDLLPETVHRLSAFSNIIGIKEARGEVERIQAIRALCGDAMDIYSGDDASAREAILAGAKGVISVTANVAPREMVQLCEAALKGDKERALAIDRPLQSLHRDLFLEANPIPVKWALSEMGLINNILRLPLTPLSLHFQATLRAALAENHLGGTK